MPGTVLTLLELRSSVSAPEAWARPSCQAPTHSASSAYGAVHCKCGVGVPVGTLGRRGRRGILTFAPDTALCPHTRHLLLNPRDRQLRLCFVHTRPSSPPVVRPPQDARASGHPACPSLGPTQRGLPSHGLCLSSHPRHPAFPRQPLAGGGAQGRRDMRSVCGPCGARCPTVRPEQELQAGGSPSPPCWPGGAWLRRPLRCVCVDLSTPQSSSSQSTTWC